MKKTEISALVAQAQAGERKALEKLWSEFSEKVYFFVKRCVSDPEAARDITSETFITAIEKISDLRSGESFVGWLYCIAYRKCTLYLKNESRLVRVESDEELSEAFENASLNEPIMLPDDYAVNEDVRSRLMKVIESLPSDMRSAVILYYYDDLSAAEVASAMNITESNVYQKLHRARQKIKKQIEKLSGKDRLFSCVPLSAVVANLENAGLLSGAGTLAAAAAVGVGVPVGLSALSGGTARHLLSFTLKYWRRHKKSLAALLFSGVLLCALICCALLTLRQEYVRQIDGMYNTEGHYEFLTTTEHQDVIDILTGEDTVTGKMNVYGLMGVGNIKYEYGSLDDPENLAHIPLESGRLPQKKGEIAIDRQVLTNFGFFGKVGDTITLDKGTYTLVGIIADDKESIDFWENSYGWSRSSSRLIVDEGKQTNYWIEDKSQFDKEYLIPLMFVSPEEQQKPEYTLVMLDSIAGLNRMPYDYNSWTSDESFDDGDVKLLQRIAAETDYNEEDIGSEISGLLKDHRQQAIDYYNGKFYEQIYTKLLLYGAAIIIAVLSVIAVMRNITAERENTISMLRRVGMSKRRIRVMYAIEYIFLGILQAVIGIAVGIGVHIGIYEYQVRVLEKSDFSGFSHNEYDRFLCPDPFIWSALIAAGVLLVGYVFALLLQRSRVPKLRRRKAGSVRRCFAKVFRNRAVTVIQTISLTLIIFGTLFGYMLFRPTIGGFDENGTFHRNLDTKFGDPFSMTQGFDFEEENVQEYYRAEKGVTNDNNLPMLIKLGDVRGIDDETADTLGESYSKGVLPQTVISSKTDLPRPVQWDAPEVKDYFYKMSTEQGKKFYDKNESLYKCKTALADKATIEKLKDNVRSGEINIDKIMSGEEMIYVYSHVDPPFKAGDKINLVSATTEDGFGINKVTEASVRIGAVIELDDSIDKMAKYCVSTGDDYNLLTTVTGAKKLGLHGASYTEIIARDEIGNLLPMNTGLRVKSLEKQKHDIFVQNATLYGSLGLLIFVMSLLGFSAYFNGIGMKIRMKEYQISIMRAIGTPLKKLRRRLMLDSVRIPLFAGTIAYGLIRITQTAMLHAYDKAESIIHELAQKAIEFGQQHPGPEIDEAYNSFFSEYNATSKQASQLQSYYMTHLQMWFNNVLIPTLIVCAVMCMITILLTRKSVGGFGSNIAYSISKGRKRR